LFVAVKSAPSVNDFKTEGDALVTADLETFKSRAENKESIKPYVKNLRDYVVKGDKNRKRIDAEVVNLVMYIDSLNEADDGHIDFKTHETFDDKLQDRILVSNTIIQSSIEWIDSRIESVKDINSKIRLVDTKVLLKKEMKLMLSLSELGAKMKNMLLQIYSPSPSQEFADKYRILAYSSRLKSKADDILESFYIPSALDAVGKLEEMPAELLLQNNTQINLEDMSADDLEVLIMQLYPEYEDDDDDDDEVDEMDEE